MLVRVLLGARTILSLVLVACLSAWALADPPRLPARKLSQPPTIDGDISDAAWSAASTADAFTDPQAGSRATEDTKVWIGYDGDAIYVAFHAVDSNPSGIVAREIQPGARFQGEDTFDFVIDPMHTKTGATSRFTLNALGTQSETISGGRVAKREWRGVWQAAVKRRDDGWSGEMRIPWSMLSLPNGQKADMGINFGRYQERTKVWSQWANLTAAGRNELIGVWEGVELPIRPWRPDVEWLGYVAPEVEERRHEIRSGLDARYRMTPTMTALASVNPDFRNIEQQIAGIEFTRTERFLEDARPFFTEGRDFFGLTGMFTFGRMFYSRRIEDFDWGAKVYGRPNRNLALGALTAVDSGDTTDAVARAEYLFGSTSGVSAYTATRLRHGLDDNGHGLNLWKRWGNYSGDVQLAGHSRTGQPGSTAGGVAASYAVPHLFAVARYNWIEPDFDPALAFIPFKDRKGQYLFTEYNKSWRSGLVSEYHADAFWASYDHYDRTPDERGFSVGNYVGFRNNLSFGVWHNRNRFGSEIHETTFTEFGINGNNRYRRLSGSYEWGKRDGVPTKFLSLNGSYRAFGKVDLSLSQSVFELDGTSRQTLLTVGWEIDRVRSLTGRVVETDGKRNAYVAYRSAGFSGLEIFVIAGDPNAESFKRRLSVKLVAAF